MVKKQECVTFHPGPDFCKRVPDWPGAHLLRSLRLDRSAPAALALLQPRPYSNLRYLLALMVQPILAAIAEKPQLVESALINGARLFLGNRVVGITKVGEEFCVETMNHHSQARNYKASVVLHK